MSSYEAKVKEASGLGLDVMIRALNGEEVTPTEMAAAKASAPMELKRQSTLNGHNRNAISMMKFLNDKQERENVALEELKRAGFDVAPRLASGEVVPETA